MRDLIAEILIGVALVALGLLVAYLVAGDRGLGINLDLAYLIGTVVFSVPAIVILERRRRRKL